MVSMHDVAARASVSLGTVSKFLNSPERVAPDTQARIGSAITELGYTRNEAARQLKTGKSSTLAFIALELNNPFFGDVADSMERRAAESNLFLSIVCANGDPAREAQYVRMLVQQRVYGIVLASGITPAAELELLYDSGMATVLLDAYPQSDRFSSSAVDDVTGARRAVEHLIAQGARRVAFVGGEMRTMQIANRLRGAQAAIDAAEGVSLEVIHTTERSVTAGVAVGEELADRPERERPDAVFAANDLLAVGVLEAVVNRGGIRIPQDLAIVGYDDIDFAAAASVPLSSVRRPREGFGRRSVDLIQDQVRSSGRPLVQHVVIQPELIVRASSAAM